MSFDELYLFDDESDGDGSGSGSPGTRAFPFCSGKYVGSVSGVGSGDFVLTGIKSLGDVVMFVPRGVNSKGGQFIELFWCPNLDLPLLLS